MKEWKIRNKKTNFITKGTWFSEEEAQDFIQYILSKRAWETHSIFWENFQLKDVEIFSREAQFFNQSLKMRLIEKEHQETKTCPLDEEDRYSATVDVLTGRVFDLWQVWHLDDLGREIIELTGTKEACEKFIAHHKNDEEWEE